MELPVVAAIPNYNMASSLKELLPQLIAEKYDEVVVLDDASTDNSVEVVKTFAPRVKLVAGTKNVGAGANRNRILDYLRGREVVIHFIDADTSLETTDVPKIAREVLSDPDIVLVGGLVKTLEGRQHTWNYGPAWSISSIPSAQAVSFLDFVHKINPKLARFSRKQLGRWLTKFPNTLEPPKATDAFWVVEANMIINSKVFGAIGGFDPKFRYHEILDFGYRLQKAGLRCRFDPRIALTHKSLQVRGNWLQRKVEMHGAFIKLVIKNMHSN